MTYCQNCGFLLEDNCNFCSNCGFKIQKQTMSQYTSNNHGNIYYNPPGIISISSLPKERIHPVEQQKTFINSSTIKSILKNNKDYHHHNKEAIRELESIVKPNETIIFAFNGSLFIKRVSGNVSYGYTTAFKNAAITTISESNGTYRNGIICLTNEKTIFATNSTKLHSVRQFNNCDIVDIILDKQFKSGILQIKTLNDLFAFSTLKYENALKYRNHLKNMGVQNG